MFEPMLFSPPEGQPAAEGTLYMSYAKGPAFDDGAQVIVPTGILQVTRAPAGGAAGVARVVKMFGAVSVNQHLVPYDSTAFAVRGRPSPLAGGPEGRVRWIDAEPVLPTLQRYVVLTLTSSDGMRIGDEVALYRPQQARAEPGQLAEPEVVVARAQVVRVTPFGSTAMIVAQTQPAISTATRARVISRLQ
jgi:hypothetical protein